MAKGLRIYREPDMTTPDLIAAWPGIGNVGLIAVDTLRRAVGAESFAEIEPWHFFYPQGILVQSGELMDLNFPRCRFFHKKLGNRDVIFFTGDEQPEGERKAYHMADLIVDLALLFGCKRVYTAAAAVTAVHHEANPRVWAVPNSERLVAEVRTYPNTVLLSEVADRGGEGNITGLNGLLLGVAKKRGLEGVCLLGEIPVYISGLLSPYPKASRSIAEVFGHILETIPDLTRLDAMEAEVKESIEQFYNMIPPEVRGRIDQLKEVGDAPKSSPGEITEDDQKRIMQDLEDFFKKGGQES